MDMTRWDFELYDSDNMFHPVKITYKCKKCGQLFKDWWCADSDWKRSGFEDAHVCRSCFEKVVPDVVYRTNDEVVMLRKGIVLPHLLPRPQCGQTLSSHRIGDVTRWILPRGRSWQELPALPALVQKR